MRIAVGFGIVTMVASVALARAERLDAEIALDLDESMKARLVSEAETPRHELQPTIRFATPGISEAYAHATGLTIEGAVRLVERGRPPVFFNVGRAVVHDVPGDVRSALHDALSKDALTLTVEPPDRDGIGALVLRGRFAVRRFGSIELPGGFAVPNLRVGRTLHRATVRLDRVEGYFGRVLAYHSGPADTRLRRAGR
jgi:hypothetical protein